MSSPKVFSANETSSVVTVLSRVKFIRIEALKSLEEHVTNACEALRAILTLSRSRGDK